jgi:hypothetical protein
MRARIGVSAAVLAATITVAACSGDEDEPSSLPDATSADSASTPTDTGSTSPADPTARLEAEITEFIQEYARVINDSWQSADALSRRREMFSDSCASCLAGYELAEQAQAQGLRFEGGIASLRDLQVDRIDGDVVTVSALTTSEAGRLLDDDNEVVQEFDASNDVQIVFQLHGDGSGNWMIISDEVLS